MRRFKVQLSENKHVYVEADRIHVTDLETLIFIGEDGKAIASFAADTWLHATIATIAPAVAK